LMTVCLFLLSQKNQHEAVSDKFGRITDVTVEAVEARMQTYLQSLAGTAALIIASDETDTELFDTYVSSLDLKQTLPGVTGIGFIAQVEDEAVPEFTAAMRANGQPEYTVRKLTSRDQHYLVKFIYPMEDNQQASGLDVTFEPKRTAILETARDTGRISLTSPIELVQHERTQPGFLLLYPVFQPTQGAGDTQVFRGWVYAAFIAENLLTDLTVNQGPYFSMHVTDDAGGHQDGLVYADRIEGFVPGSYTAQRKISHFGRVWTVDMTSSQLFDAAYQTRRPLTVLGIGTLATLLLVLTLRNARLRSDTMAALAALRQRQAKASKDQSRSIIDNALTAIMVLDSAQEVVFANKAAQRCFGYDEGDMVGMPFGAFVDDTDNAPGNGTIGYTKSQKVLSLDLQCNDWLNVDNAHRRTVIIRDLTAERATQRELNRTKTLYDMALRGSEIGVYDIDLTSGKSDVSETWCQIMGYTGGCKEIDTQAAFLSRIHPADRIRMEQSDAVCLQGHSERSIVEYRMKFGEAEWRWMRSDSVVAERSKDGTPLRMIGTQTDITQIRHARNALEASEQLFRQLLDAAPIGMATMDDKGTFTGLNNAFSDLYGIPEEKLKYTMRIGDVMAREEVKKLYAGVAELMARGGTETYQGEHQIIHADGSVKWGLFHLTWTYDKNTNRNVFIAQVNDVTDQVKLAKAKDEFVATVSHELRTPLTSITGALGLLAVTPTAAFTTSQNRLIEIAKSNAVRLTSIVNDILDLEKISSGEVAFNYADCDLNQMIASTVEEITPFAVTHNNIIKTDLPAEPLMVHADFGRTCQVLVNLISNACKYSTPDSVVLVRTERLDDRVIVYVQNHGPGVPDSFRANIFQAFSQADSSDTRTEGGTGLGLNITRQIVDRHGGQIGFESIPDSVTVFWFTYPVAAPGTQAPDRTVRNAVTVEGPKMRVLHIEDDGEFAEIVSQAVSPVALTVNVSSLSEARRALGGGAFDAVLLDWRLRDGDASDLLGLIEARMPDAHIISLSADAERAQDERVACTIIKGQAGLDRLLGELRIQQKIVTQGAA